MKPVLQIINSTQGRPEYVLLPVLVYKQLQKVIDLALFDKNEDYVDFEPSHFIKNPIALKRMKSKITQTELAAQLHVSQAYISKIEQDDYKIAEATLKKAYKAITKLKKIK
jgi:DNA-binding XRE family transcriptional regulator